MPRLNCSRAVLNNKCNRQISAQGTLNSLYNNIFSVILQMECENSVYVDLMSTKYKVGMLFLIGLWLK